MARSLSTTPPQKPSAGKCMVAVTPEVYTALRSLAIVRGTTLGGLVAELLAR